jgi:hypothetical protein
MQRKPTTQVLRPLQHCVSVFMDVTINIMPDHGCYTSSPGTDLTLPTTPFRDQHLPGKLVKHLSALQHRLTGSLSVLHCRQCTSVHVHCSSIDSSRTAGKAAQLLEQQQKQTIRQHHTFSVRFSRVHDTETDCKQVKPTPNMHDAAAVPWPPEYHGDDSIAEYRTLCAQRVM